MHIPKLDNRLLKIAGFIKKNAVVADVGTDHAYLPVYLVKKGIVQKAYACDVAKKPLLQAKQTIEKYNASKNIEAVLSNGLDNVKKNDIDTVVIAGMGGKLIMEIILKAAWLKNDDIELVLQPMTFSESLRSSLYANGFEIFKEKLVSENDFIYTIMLVKYTNKNKNLNLYEKYTGKILDSIDLNSMYIKPYFEKIVKKLNLKIQGIEKSSNKNDEILKQQAEIKALAARLNDLI